MAFDITKSREIINIMENYIASIRPEPKIRPKLDIGFELTDVSRDDLLRQHLSRVKKSNDENTHSIIYRIKGFA
jgi:hypothetical protein